MPLTVTLTAEHLQRLDLEPARTVLQPIVEARDWLSHEQQLQFQIDFPREPYDPRELSEIPEVRLWFIRLDALYPWLPFLLDWKAGELARYAAMLIPHQFHPSDGVQFNPEALEIWVMHKIFILQTWQRQQGIEGTSRLKALAQLLGYEIEDDFFALVAL